MENQKPQQQSDEIDLGQLFNRMGNAIRGFGLGIMLFLARVRRIPLENKRLFILVLLASTILGLIYSSFLKKQYYESTMILSSNYLNKRLVENTIEKLNQLAEEKSKRGLSHTLGLTDSMAINIIGFEAKPFVAENDLIELEVLKEQLRSAQADNKNELVIDQVIQRIEIENRHAFEITIRTLNPSVVSSLQDALVDYFRTNNYIKKRIEINRLNLLERKNKLQRDIERLDSLKFVIYDNYKSMAAQSRQGSNNVILSDKSVTNPVEIYVQDLDLYNQLQAVEKELYLQPDFEIVDGFTEFSEPASIGPFKTVLWALLAGIVLAYLIVGFSQFNRYLDKLS